MTALVPGTHAAMTLARHSLAILPAVWYLVTTSAFARSFAASSSSTSLTSSSTSTELTSSSSCSFFFGILPVTGDEGSG